jgi:hypothetical protein
MCDARGRLTVIIARGLSIARTLALQPITPAEAEDNARRIIACINACQGIPTEALERGSLQVALDWAWKAYAEGFRSEGLAEKPIDCSEIPSRRWNLCLNAGRLRRQPWCAFQGQEDVM